MKSILYAVIITALLAGWIYSGTLSADATSDDNDANADASQSLDQKDALAMHVRVRASRAQKHHRTIKLRGRTEAWRTVDVKSETSGRVIARPVERGDQVEKGALLCELATDDRYARLAETEAILRQFELEYQAASKLAKKGHRSETQVAATEAARDGAKASLERMQVELARTRITAPFAGVVDATHADIGSYLQAGAPCVQLVDLDPMRIVGFLAERDAGLITEGTDASISLLSGTERSGQVNYVAVMANPATRTFRMEVEVDNKDGSLKDGITAEIQLTAGVQMAHFLPPSLLTLNADGQLGIRTVDDKNQVVFMAIEIADDNRQGIWVTGLPDEVRVIVVGQDYVTHGQMVRVTMDETAGAGS